MQIPKTPDHVDYEALSQALGAVGIDVTDLCRLTANPSVIELTYQARNSDGKRVRVGDHDVATITVTVPITRPKTGD